MKVLHINSFPYGGAFTGAYRLHEALLKHGVASKMLVSLPPLNQILSEVFFYNKPFRNPNIFNAILSEMGFPITANQMRKHYIKGIEGKYEIISFPFSDFDITESKEYHEAEIIHLHWIAGFIDYKRFFKKCKKPVVFTLRDLNPILGIFHYEGDKERNKSFDDIEKKALDTKISSLKEI